ncbi:MAG: aspartate/tyrosine/aromatic aminotransferase [Opitutales bacterium]|jgi:aspartate/tyrosine/aromatic aminotransferase|nr:aspartate/tyrosine/aromatic aminotransferase [Opitutales bacterium]MBT6380710.1 aspartate/tyrosine/aromatic aminotransferase [Opitutales bacterium]MBT6769018.1 aspartate/tyrosine/aromatic aminotransferase [Opitutales bacterium]MBT7866774.1 aspartate/tyrosine/aromatic aminotransferase [Opitutales bacterium]
MSQFDSVSLAPADPILSITEAFKADSNPDKINLSVGVFVDDSGVTPILGTVREAEKRIVETNATKSYLPITGSPNYGALTQKLCFGNSLADSLKGRIITAHTPGGTGALRVAADFISSSLEANSVWLSNPTWANHKGIFSAAGLEPQTYAYFDQSTLSLDYPAFIESIKTIPAGDIVILHACCHNPTGADLSPAQWDEVAAIAANAGWIPLLDFAYQGFGTDIETDAYCVRAFAQTGKALFVCQSFSKNIGLYRERVGALHVVVGNEDEAKRVTSQVKIAVRTNYSNPPAHGGAIVETVLGNADLRSTWITEVTAMRERIHEVRDQFVRALEAAGVGRDFSFLKEQKGMFSFTGLTKEQAIGLRQDHSIYIVDSGRINVAGITSKNLPRLVEVLKGTLS